MIRRSLRFLGGGHDHGMPTTKEAAHLTQEWIMSRPPPPPPGRGMRYAAFTHPAHKTKFQFNSPEQHEVKAVHLTGHREAHEVTARTRLSDKNIAAVLRGLEHDLSPSTEVSADRLADAPAVEARKKSIPSIQNLMQYDHMECSDYLHNRGGDLAHRLKDYNPKGHERELFPWVPKPPAPAPPQKK